MRKKQRDGAMKKAKEMGMAFREFASGEGRRDASLDGNNAAFDKDTSLRVTIGTEPTLLKQVKDAMVESLGGDHHWRDNERYGGGWAGSKWTASPDGGGTCTAMAWSGGRGRQGNSFNEQLSYLAEERWIRQADLGGGSIDRESFGFDARVKVFLLEEGERQVEFDGVFNGRKGTYRCVPHPGHNCAARQGSTSGRCPNIELGGTGPNEGWVVNGATWAFRPDSPDGKKLAADGRLPVYGWWLRVSPSGETTASAFESFRGNQTSGGDQQMPASRRNTASTSRQTFGKARHTGAAAGLYALDAERGDLTATAEPEADFGLAAPSDVPDGTATGVTDGFMVRGLDSGKARAGRDWKVELAKLHIGDSGTAASHESSLAKPDGGGRTKWFLVGRAPFRRMAGHAQGVGRLRQRSGAPDRDVHLRAQRRQDGRRVRHGQQSG